MWRSMPPILRTMQTGAQSPLRRQAGSSVWQSATVDVDACDERAETFAQAPGRWRQADPDWVGPRSTEQPETSRGQDLRLARQHAEMHRAVESQSAPESLAPR